LLAVRAAYREAHQPQQNPLRNKIAPDILVCNDVDLLDAGRRNVVSSLPAMLGCYDQRRAMTVRRQHLLAIGLTQLVPQILDAIAALRPPPLPRPDASAIWEISN